jgi:Polyketide cyclase / dehydrase and lipid transport
MPTDGRTLNTSAPPARVWQIWSDPPTWSTWNPDVISASLDGPFARGTTGTLVTKQARHAITLTSVDLHRSFTLDAKPMPGLLLRFTCHMEPAGDGSRIGQSVEVTGPLATFIGRPMAKSIAAGFEPILLALKQRVEREA